MRMITGAALALLMGLPVGVAAQANPGFAIGAGLAAPLGDFADPDVFNEWSGGATTGFWAGIDVAVTLPVGGLQWLTSVSAASFGVDEAFTNAVFEDVSEGERADEVDTGPYWLFPVVTGLRLHIPVGRMAILPMAQAGLGVLTGPDVTWTVGGQEVTSTIEPGGGVAYVVGAAFVVTRQIEISVRYVEISLMEREYEISGFGQSYVDDAEQPASALQIGIFFNP